LLISEIKKKKIRKRKEKSRGEGRERFEGRWGGFRAGRRNHRRSGG
jgi:hypothetical protein